MSNLELEKWSANGRSDEYINFDPIFPKIASLLYLFHLKNLIIQTSTQEKRFGQF